MAFYDDWFIPKDGGLFSPTNMLPSEPTGSSFLERLIDPSKVEMNYNAYQADLARRSEQEFNALEAQKAFDRQLSASNTAYQRAVEDLKKAGLNPYLAYNQGGATVPSSVPASSTGKVGHASLGSGIIPVIINSAVKLAGIMSSNAIAQDSASNAFMLEALRAMHKDDNTNLWWDRQNHSRWK